MRSRRGRRKGVPCEATTAEGGAARGKEKPGWVRSVLIECALEGERTAVDGGSGKERANAAALRFGGTEGGQNAVHQAEF